MIKIYPLNYYIFPLHATQIVLFSHIFHKRKVTICPYPSASEESIDNFEKAFLDQMGKMVENPNYARYKKIVMEMIEEYYCDDPENKPQPTESGEYVQCWTLKKIVESDKYPFSRGHLRYYLRHRRTNGLGYAVGWVGRKLVIRMDLFDEWIEDYFYG